MLMSSHLLDRGIGLWKSGNGSQAHRLFETIIYNDPCNETAWIWYIYTLQTNEEKIAALENFLAVFPQHIAGRKALASLRAEADDQHLHTKSTATISPPKDERLPQAKSVSIPTSRPVQKSWAKSVATLMLILGMCILLGSSSVFIAGYKSLQAENQRLASDNQLITDNFVKLNSDYGALESKNNQLSAEYDALSGRYSALNNEYRALDGKYQSLSAEHATLQTSYDSLLKDYNYTVQSFSAFKEIAIAPPYIYTRGRTVHLVFQKLNGSLLRWDISSDWLEYHLRRGDELRRDLTYDLSLYNEFTDETYDVVDDRDFVDATPFTNVMTDLYNSAPDDSTFIHEAWNIVAQLTAYTPELGETPRFPLETLLSGGGDCEDHAILFASMLLASPVQWEVKFIYMDSEHPTQPQTVNHVIVQVVTDNTRYLVEATSKDTMNPYGEGVYGWSYSINGSDQ